MLYSVPPVLCTSSIQTRIVSTHSMRERLFPVFRKITRSLRAATARKSARSETPSGLRSDSPGRKAIGDEPLEQCLGVVRQDVEHERWNRGHVDGQHSCHRSWVPNRTVMIWKEWEVSGLARAREKATAPCDHQASGKQVQSRMRQEPRRAEGRVFTRIRCFLRSYERGHTHSISTRRGLASAACSGPEAEPPCGRSP